MQILYIAFNKIATPIVDMLRLFRYIETKTEVQYGNYNWNER